MKKNVMMRVAALLLVCVLATTCGISGTFAKYTSTGTATDTARVAKFSVMAFGQDVAKTNTATVDIFNTVYDTKDVGDFTVDGTDEEDISNGSDPIIAPGSWGKFSFTLENESEVTVNYTIDYTVNEAGVPLKWSIDGTTWNEELADVTEAVTLAIGSDAKTITIYWKWDFAGNDTDDTNLGIADPLATPSIRIDVTFTQVD